MFAIVSKKSMEDMELFGPYSSEDDAWLDACKLTMNYACSNVKETMSISMQRPIASVTDDMMRRLASFMVVEMEPIHL